MTFPILYGLFEEIFMLNKIITLLIFCSGSLLSQDSTLVTILQHQVDAYNTQNVNALVENVSDDFKYFALTKDTLMLETSGKDQFRKSMERYFNVRKNFPNSIIESYSIVSNRISFKETVSHINKSGQKVASSAMGIYQIEHGKITRAWYFYD